MTRVRLLHWNAAEAKNTIDALDAAGYAVEYDEKFSPALMRNWRQSPPDAFVIHLSRLPSHGREIAIALRQSPKTRHVPIVFCEGASEKVDAIRALLPDANFCTEATLLKALKSAKAPENPVKPTDMMNRYSGRTVAQKLGIRERSTVALIEPPRDAMTALGPLPKGVEFTEDVAADVTLCFIHQIDGLQNSLSNWRKHAARTNLWILWRKKTAAGHAGVTEALVRETGIDLGLVDYKICSVNETWSAMLFAKRKE